MDILQVCKDKLAYIRNPFTANAQMLQTGTGMQDLQCVF